MESLSATFMLPAPALRHAGVADVHKSPPILLLHYPQDLHMQPRLLISSSSPITPPGISASQEELANKPSSFQAPIPAELGLVGAGMLLLFWFANFVVPALIFKDMPKPEGEGDEAPKKKTILDILVGSIEDTYPDGAAMISSQKSRPRGTGFGGKVSKRVGGKVSKRVGGDDENKEESIQL